jgi:hypothetical protein
MADAVQRHPLHPMLSRDSRRRVAAVERMLCEAAGVRAVRALGTQLGRLWRSYGGFWVWVADSAARRGAQREMERVLDVPTIVPTYVLSGSHCARRRSTQKQILQDDP